MADTQPFKPQTIYDRIDTVELGMNSGIDPLLLPRNQLAFATNLTTRQGFATDRPPFSNVLTIVWPSTDVQEAFEQGLFQGAAYYQPDAGPESLFASVSGRLYQFVISGTTATVYDRTITGDPNPESSTQAWLWQAENYLITNDGISLPIFFDGNSSRRSYGATAVLATASATNPPAGVVPEIGSQIVLTLPDLGRGLTMSPFCSMASIISQSKMQPVTSSTSPVFGPCPARQSPSVTS